MSKKTKFVTECPKCSKVYTNEDINGGRCTGKHCGTMITDPKARALSTIKNADKDAELRKLRAENKAMKNVIEKIYDVLYFETDREDDFGNAMSDVFNPDKAWDSAADFVEMIAEQLTTILPLPTLGSTTYPEIKTK